MIAAGRGRAKRPRSAHRWRAKARRELYYQQ
jgi:hypothetical protein